LALLLVDKKSCAEFYRDNEAKRIKQIHHWKGAVSLERLLFLEGYYKAFSVIGANCVLCKQCAYPGNCLFPQEKRPSVESYSIDLIGTLQKIGMLSQVAKNKIEPFNSYSIVLVH
jgi:predicted metal-binding protein